ncbi:response regulator [Actinoplanes sp. TBRC 11911]|uniref:response regulator n=1 Tax=Actinoplanes sp. TBRC 11911 TaxID=2729386 RepID=UPI00145EF847|nr:response regulator [Actinoplanes sp. TBRC 11911]NMO56186.1 response regulator [Actinoplanes sp. TBRC 11911]
MWNTSDPPKGPVVLLVEDDEDLREMTTQMLELRGFHVLSANDAVTAITTCRVYDGTIDVLLTDLGLPGVSGGELARSAHSVRPQMEVVYVSGIPQDIAVKKGLIKAGAPFISKPFTTDVLAGTLRSVLVHHSNLPAP